MNREQIIQLAHEAGTTFVTQYGVASATPEWLERFATLVAAAEREACAVVAAGTVCNTHIPTGVKVYGARAAKAIRARGEK